MFGGGKRETDSDDYENEKVGIVRRRFKEERQQNIIYSHIMRVLLPRKTNVELEESRMKKCAMRDECIRLGDSGDRPTDMRLERKNTAYSLNIWELGL